ncbi:diacylglycerol kinase [Streptomyces bungoensis]|uniref:Diacylglycerol kinase n=1 Tax=Streptomyces bungoensis TaxID=285568 RepID=A0A124I5M1_9ACTN|nr:diacylglycerol kinase family protein [Streptomyces bungoensis]KUN90359.1 diacylglycerol kinase [Streptomyces bungoensis]
MSTAVPERPAELPGAGPDEAPGAVGRSRPAMPRGIGWSVRWIAALTVCQATLMVGLGLLITGPARHLWPLTAEDGVNEAFVRMRTGTLTTLSSIASQAGNTGTVIGVTLASCLGLILIPRLPMWRQAVFLAVAVSLQSLVFLVITFAVDRHRPEVHRLDGSLPTSSYTSGHTGAATAIYGGLALLALSRLRGPWRTVVACLLCVLPLLVGLARLYRGMHHPTDVMGGLVNGTLSLLIARRALLADGAVAAPPAPASTPTSGPSRPAAPGRTAVIFNPTVTDEAGRDALRRVLEHHGHTAPVFVETTADDPGGGQTAGAVRDGATLVVVCGGDGTLRAAAESLAGTDVQLALVPCGTGNLLARNLGLPLAPADALDAALRGTPHRVDLARIEGDGLPPTHFAAMAGAGLDAATMRRANANDRAKAVLGWPTYVLAVLRELRTPRTRVSVRLDGAPALRRTARMVLVGNIGTVQGGVTVLPDARADDGRLDLLILDPRGLGGWLSALWTLLRGGTTAARESGDGGAPVEFFTFRRAEFTFDSELPRELDGDPVTAGRHLTAEVRPGALTVLLPARER